MTMEISLSLFTLLHTYGKDLATALRNVQAGVHPRYLLPSIDAIRLTVIGAISFRETRRRVTRHLTRLIRATMAKPIQYFRLEEYITTLLTSVLGEQWLGAGAVTEKEAVDHRLKFEDARFSHSESLFISQLVLYHVPRLLPSYRDKLERDPEGREYSIPVKAFCKWHKMVYPNAPHPTHREAKLLMKSFSNRDLSMIYKMSKLLYEPTKSDRYLRAWRRWMDSKGPDVAILFGEDKIDNDPLSSCASLKRWLDSNGSDEPKIFGHECIAFDALASPSPR